MHIAKIYTQSIEDYPTPQEFYKSIGLPEYNNACAARMSYALNESKTIEIPFIEGKTRIGKDGKCYFMFARDMRDWLSSPQVWGQPRVYNNHKIFRLKNGIVAQSGFSHGITGHIEYFYKGHDGHLYSNHMGAQSYYEQGAVTEIWKYGR